MPIVRLILAIILPPVGAYLQVRLTTHFWINLVLTIIGYVPGIIHALWLILTDKKE
ncbi:MAG: YqaE/Pmp3 family membrane protein [Candidatus Latescibacteria bacterium]|nr:YqaE/Pmp3 family membrane protein [Candidatus Latescibacterota bacterium]